MLRHAGGVRGKKLLDAVRGGAGGGIEIACAELKRDGDRSAFASAEFRSAGKRIAPGALRLLVSAFQEDLAELASACQQLIADTGATSPSRPCETYYAGRVETDAFAVADAALAGRRGEALVLLRHAIDSGADPVPIVAALAMKLRTMARVLRRARQRSAQVASELGLAPWQVDRARRDAAGLGAGGLGRAIVILRRDRRAREGRRARPRVRGRATRRLHGAPGRGGALNGPGLRAGPGYLAGCRAMRTRRQERPRRHRRGRRGVCSARQSR